MSTDSSFRGAGPAAGGPASVAGWPVEAICRAVRPMLPGFTVGIVPEIDSTNSELMRRARAGRTEPVLLVAEHQSAGRGRLGRTWSSGASAALPSLTFSLGLPLAPADWSGLSLAVGVSLAESLHERIQLKWPNDLWLNDRKLAGVLIETASFGGASTARRFAVVGIGINIAAPDSAGFSIPAAPLRELWPDARPGDALARLVAPLAAALRAFEESGFAPFQARFNARDVLRERLVVLSDGTQGVARGVDERGGLLVHTDRGVETVTSSEVSVRPAL